MLQNPKLNNKKLTLFKKLSAIDLAVFVVCIFFSMGIGFLFQKKFGVKISIGVAIVAFLSTAWVLIKSPKHHCKFYELFFLMLKHYINVRKYKKKTNADTSMLIPYEDIEDNIVVNKTSNLGKSYFSAIKIRGFNVFINIENDRENDFFNFTQLLNSVTDKITIVKTSGSMDLSANIKNAWQNINFNLNYDFLQEYIPKNVQEIETLNNSNNIDNYYLVVFSTKKSDLLQLRTNLIERLKHTKFSPVLVERYELIQLLNCVFKIDLNTTKIDNLLNPSGLNSNFENNLSDILAPENVEFFSKHIKVNDKFISFQTLNSFTNIEILDGWVYNLFKSKSTVIWNLSFLDETLKEKILNNASEIIELNTNKKSKFKTAKSDITIQVLENLIYEVNSNNSNIFNSNFIFVNEAQNLNELKQIENENNLNASNVNAKLNPMLFKQKQTYNNACLVYSDNLNDNLEMISNNISRGWGFINSDLNDKSPLLLGFDRTTNSPLFFDIKTKNASRTYSNMLITGIPGSGKSTLMKKILMHYLIYSTDLIVVDPQREYNDLAKKMGGNVIELGSGINTIINPLQLDMMFFDNENDTNQNVMVITANIKKLQKFFKLLFNFTDLELRFIAKTLSELYTKYGFFSNTVKLTNLKNTDFPIITDYINFLDKYHFQDEIEKDIYLNSWKLILITLKSEFLNNGMGQKLFNGFTNINLESSFNVIDTYNLSTKDDSPYSKAGIFLILSFIQNKISNNFFKNKNINKWIMLVIDEAHKFIDPINPITLDFVWDTAKTIRKYRGILVLGTQNFMDFNQNQLISSKSQGILENMQYSITLNSNQKDIEALNNLFENRLPLTQQELRFLGNCPVGSGILSIDNSTRFQFNSYFNEFEKSLLFKNGDLNKVPR
ncbi:Mbov_0397 family ICE element conjugal transfer ATPase [Metamycoplasma hyosynoviae]|uniref:Mbov_0397 family ICE element conjugal transfer ATPase n=1 Tax=Metamycoplasma hyosynoviae TaxID=29559 RepID=UPI0023625DBF|nr:DUF87 domain-containing protein [Metamycoplasma hyosynoviae]MDD1373077.1 ATP-binding protein [Metamycoplasma hyosynoviae]MDD7896123.1 ATP-binding protein [Metamycoplasma hyosynoviae]